MEYTLGDLIDVPKVQALLDALDEIHSLPSAIIDTDGRILTATAWTDICAKFHRVNPQTEAKCRESDSRIAREAAEQTPYARCVCPMGLVDTATPIIVGGQHVGNVFTGQLFVEPPDEQLFIRQARQYGFDEDAYIDALRRVPLVSEERLRQNLEFLGRFTELLAAQGLTQRRHREAETALRDSEERHRTIVEAAMDGFWLADMEGRLLEVNEAYCRMSGYSSAELRAMRISDLEATESAIDTAAHIATVVAQGEDRFESSHRRKDGSVLDVEIGVKFLPIEGGRILTFIRDITERKQAEDALRTLKVKIGSQELYSVLVEMASEGFWLLDRQFNTVYVNPAMEEMLGYAKAEMIGRSWYDFGDPEWVARAKELEKRRETGISEAHPFLFVHRNGRKVLARIATTPLYDASGTFDGALGILSDMSRQKEAEDALKVKDMLDSIATSSGIGMSLIDPDYTVAWINEQLVAWFGASAQVVGRNCFEVFEGRDSICPACPARASFGTGEVAVSERSGITTSLGADRTIALTTSSIRDVTGRVLQVVELAQDITERLRAEEGRARLEAQLRHAQKMESVGRLAGGVAHDFNNMLGVILGNTENALRQVDPALPLHDDLLEVRKAAERSADLTRQLLAFARRQTVAPKVLDLNETVAGTLKMLKRLIGESIRLRWQPGAGLWPVEVDPSQVDQILANLCVNGRDAIADVGTITIETANATVDAHECLGHAGIEPGAYVRLTVRDDGTGMDEETQAHLFEPFYTTKDLGRGTGLGLATVYGIVTQNHGFIDVRSEPGRGTTFAILLPRSQGTAQPPRTDRAAGSPLRGDETILLVEDEPAILKLVARMLAGQGYAVLQAASPPEAIRVAGEHVGRIDLLLTDVILPEMNGWDLAATLLSHRPQAKCLFMSGYPNHAVARDGLVAEEVRLIQKPFSLHDLAKRVREALDGD